ncbi:hypothetical protein LENED_011928 [Lentinula edodes]|uniref:Nephrocystin 3-like N-terminal domain-containing protein n=1 Tax=Lentinula edodes TaxID=5353 RepID=A0A1Q3ERD3_LENED|nr:hypothetical protein LENED_011928 [Lentinula edodes]
MSAGMFPNASNFAIYGGNFTVITNNEIHKIRQWLNAPDCSVNFATAVNKKCSGTGQWIFELDTYKEWGSNHGILWIQGPAGSGKTFLITTITENLQNMKQKSPVWYHYDILVSGITQRLKSTLIMVSCDCY